MRRRILAVMCAIWAVTILACTGATATVLALPGGLFFHQDDYWVWSLGRANPNDGLVGGHITKVGFDDRFVLIRADDYETYYDVLSAAELLAFDRILEKKLYEIDRAEIQEHTDGSDDGFLYARGFVVAAGKGYYDAVNAKPSIALMDFECEEMCYLSWHIHNEKFGDVPQSGISRETGSNKAGWPDLG